MRRGDFWRNRALELRAAVESALAEWDAEDEDDNYSKGDAAADLRHAMRNVCTCPAPPHDRRCPVRLARKATTQ